MNQSDALTMTSGAVTERRSMAESLTLRLRLFGRLCFVATRLESEDSYTIRQLQVMGVRVDRNPEMGFPKHVMRLSVPLGCVESYSKRPDHTSYSSDLNASEVTEYYIWDLSDCAITVEGDQQGSVTLETSDPEHQFARLDSLVSDRGIALAESVRNDPAQSAANAILTVNSGVLRPFSPRGAKMVAFAPLDAALPSANLTRVYVAEGGEILLRGEHESITLCVTRWTDGESWRITVAANRTFGSADAILSLSNKCGSERRDTLAVRDEEFASYYELFTGQTPPSDRLIPVLAEHRISIGSCDVPALVYVRED